MRVAKTIIKGELRLHIVPKTLITRTHQSHVFEDLNDCADQMMLYLAYMYYHFCNVMLVPQDIQCNHTKSNGDGGIQQI